MARRTPARPARGTDRPRAGRVDRKFTLSTEAAQRVDLHAVGTGQTASAVVEALIVAHLRRFVLVDRGGGGPIILSTDGASGQGQGPATASA